MNSIHCIVLEDEEPAQNLMRNYFNRMPDFELMEVFDNALEASDFLEHHLVDLIITDVEMPRLSGLDFIRMLPTKPPIIIITASPEYAFQSYELDVIAYLRKPVSFEQFQKAINKVKPLLLNNVSLNSFMYVKEGAKTVKVAFEDIIYVEGLGDYVRIITKERVITVLTTMSKIMESLPSKIFMRVHKSYIINTDKINSIDSANSLVIMNNKKEITIGRTFKPNFMARVKPIN